jgi:hypothetical protein
MNYEKSNSIIKFYFTGSRCVSNISWALSIIFGGFGFFLEGVASFFEVNYLIFPHSTEFQFLPQGIVLLFYGTVGSILGIFLILNIWWNVGSGYNEYNREIQQIKLYRRRFPGKTQELILNFSFEEVKSIKLKIKEGIASKRQLLLCLKDSREIPLTGIEQPTGVNKLEDEAILIATYLNVSLETE